MNQKVNEFLKNIDKNDVRFFADKFGQSVFMVHNPISDKDNWIYIKIYETNSLQEIGHVDYSITNCFGTKEVYLHNIIIDKVENLGRGIGGFAIKFLEEITAGYRLDVIEGKFYPIGVAKAQDVRKFYARNGYFGYDNQTDTYKPYSLDGYDKSIYKYLSKDEIACIKNNTRVNEDDYFEYGPLKNMYLQKEETIER